MTKINGANKNRPTKTELLTVLCLLYLTFTIGVFGLSMVYYQETGNSLSIGLQIVIWLLLCLAQSVYARYGWDWPAEPRAEPRMEPESE